MRALWTIGVDLGGTKLEVGIVDSSGHVIDHRLIKTKVKEGPKAVIKDIVNAINELRQKHSEGIIGAIGVGIAGQIDKKNGTVNFAPNLNWHDVPLQNELQDSLNLPVFVINDVRAAAWGEWLFGAGKGSDDILCLFVGTGIGGGIVSGGRMLTGCSNSAGEIGHMTIDKNGPKCTCGNIGCFEALAGGWAIARRTREAVANNIKSSKSLLSLSEGKIEELTPKHLFQAALQQDPLACSIVDSVSKDLIAGNVGLVNAFNPERLILGGGIINGRPEFIEEIRKGVASRALKTAVSPLKIVQAALKANAGVIGAAAFAREASSEGEKDD